MTNQSISSVIKEAFWTAVEKCLVLFHSVSPKDAHDDVQSLREQLTKETKDSPIIYHDDPFYLAADMAGSNLTLNDETYAAYDKILRSVGLAHTRG